MGCGHPPEPIPPRSRAGRRRTRSVGRRPTREELGERQAAVGQVVDGRQELVAGQITSDAEHHQNAGVRDTRKAKVAGVEKRVGRRVGLDDGNGVAESELDTSAFLRIDDRRTRRHQRTVGALRRSDRDLTET